MKKFILTAGISLLFSLLTSVESKAATFTIADPEVDFDAIDANIEGLFDGAGDAIFDTFNIVLLGTEGEAREIAEFDIRGFTVPPNEVINNATFQARITSTIVCGLGVSCNATLPTSLGVYGYVGNGIAEASDFQAGTLLDSVAPPSYSIGDILTFDVTSFIKNLVNNGDFFAGLGVRAQQIGGLAIEESSTFGFPRLTITTAAVSTTVPEPSIVLGFLSLGALGAISKLKRKLLQKKFT